MNGHVIGHRNPASRRHTVPCPNAFGLPADRRFHPPVDLRDERTMALLPTCEIVQARRAAAHHADVLAAERRTRFGFTVS